MNVIARGNRCAWCAAPLPHKRNVKMLIRPRKNKAEVRVGVCNGPCFKFFTEVLQSKEFSRIWEVGK